MIPAGDATPDVLYNALGDTVNVAARLQSLGDLVVGPDGTAGRREFELEPLGELELKGKAESVAAFRVTGERATPVETVTTPLVGRDDELALLERIWPSYRRTRRDRRDHRRARHRQEPTEDGSAVALRGPGSLPRGARGRLRA